MGMKNLVIFIIIVLIGTLGYVVLRKDEKILDETIVKYKTFSSNELGFEFEYRTDPEGYILTSRDPSREEAKANLLKTFVLMLKTDQQNMETTPVPSEGPATITIHVVKNTKKLWPAVWASENVQLTNINLELGDITETVIGGANAIRYSADGLYRSDNAVVAHGENIYVISSGYIDENANTYKDFDPLLASIKFIPQPNQE